MNQNNVTQINGDVAGDSTTTGRISVGETIASELSRSPIDVSDAYALELEAGQVVRISAEDDGFLRSVTIRDANGNILASPPRVPRSPSFFEQDFVFLADTAQTVFLTVSSSFGAPGSLGPAPGGEYRVTVTDITPSTPDGAVFINGTPGNDILDGTQIDDDIFGGNRPDRLNGRGGEDFIQGGNGDDTLSGGRGDDALFGGSGNDRLTGGEGSDFLTGGRGNDFLAGGDRADDLFGNRGNDTINGGNGNDFINGGRGNDNLSGGNGQDAIIGGRGNDTINGGTGNDILTGNAGSDTFVFREGSGFDTITDFSSGRDRIDLSDFDYDNFNDLNLVEQNGNTFVFIDAETSIELTGIDSASDLSADDFIL